MSAEITSEELFEGNRYKPSQLYHAAEQLFHEIPGGEALCDSGGGALNSKRYALKSPNDTIIMPPATDQILSENPNTGPNGGYPINDATKHAQQFLKNSDTKRVFIPIVQTRGIFFGYGPKRQHFTYLKLEKDPMNGGTISATHVDSKGFLARVYPLDGVRDALKEAGFKDTPKLNTVYTGQQAFNDDHNCGRYTLAGIRETAIMGKIPATLPQDKLDEIDNAYKKYHREVTPKQEPQTSIQDDFDMPDLSRSNGISSVKSTTSSISDNFTNEQKVKKGAKETVKKAFSKAATAAKALKKKITPNKKAKYTLDTVPLIEDDGSKTSKGKQRSYSRV